MIEKPGIYYDMDCADYYADPCPQPSLTQSIAKILLERSPLHAWYAHPKLNPDYQHDDDTKFDVGNIAHAILLGRGKEIEVLEFNDWRTKASQEARILAAANGKLAVLHKHHSKARRMADAAREQLALRRMDTLFSDLAGESEVVLAWKEGDFWFRQMIDWLSDDRKIFADFKTTDMSVAPHCLGRLMANAGWHIQAAMAKRGLGIVGPKTPVPKTQFLFVVQECSPPYMLNVVEISDDVMTLGVKMLSTAADKWAACMAANQFPGYPLQIQRPEFPGWAENEWLEREVQEAARERRPDFDPNIIMAG